MLRIKELIFIVLVCFTVVCLSDDNERSLAGCFTGLNRCTEWTSWLSSRFMESCNDYCIRGGNLNNFPRFFTFYLLLNIFIIN